MNITDGCVHSSYSSLLLQDLTVAKTYSPALLVIFCAVNIVAAICSSSGNALVFLTVLSFSELHISSNIGLASLAAANFFEGLSIHCFCAFGSVLVLQGDCPLSSLSRCVLYFLTNVFVYSAVLNLTLVTLERYVGVIHSLRYHVILPRQRIVKFIIAIWIISLFVSVPFLIDNPTVYKRSETILTATLFVALTVTFYFNLRIHRASRRQRRQVRAQEQVMMQFTAENQQRYRFRGAKNNVFIFIALLICFVPALATRILKPPQTGRVETQCCSVKTVGRGIFRTVQ
ncbi:hypothetical protein OS493_032342 [Desmophyllum pertusum]|uniref:G-protein coupled receptors family 1 profile domain-containing protein n=1 Tax=Desmophyllum pertusum TaxID=174260 RepID=A0A9X0CPC4_9CNID|nr:hypothetical protein OS493_032342 [Desmophyllum pertusum]